MSTTKLALRTAQLADALARPSHIYNEAIARDMFERVSTNLPAFDRALTSMRKLLA